MEKMIERIVNNPPRMAIHLREGGQVIIAPSGTWVIFTELNAVKHYKPEDVQILVVDEDGTERMVALKYLLELYDKSRR